MVLGALGGDLGGILVPRRSKVEKKWFAGRSRAPLLGAFLDTFRHMIVSDRVFLRFLVTLF